VVLFASVRKAGHIGDEFGGKQMKKAGILFGQEDTFPQALIDRVNSRNAGVAAEAVRIDKLIQG